MPSEAADTYRQIGAQLCQFALENADKPLFAATLQGLVADLTPHQPDLAIPLRDLVSRPLFLASARQLLGGAGVIQRDALTHELGRIYSKETLEALEQILNGFLGLPDHQNTITSHPEPEEEEEEESSDDWSREDENTWATQYNETYQSHQNPHTLNTSNIDEESKLFGYLDDVAEALRVPVGYVWAWCIDNNIKLKSIKQPIDLDTARYIYSHYKTTLLGKFGKAIMIALFGTLIIAIILGITAWLMSR